MRRDKTWDFIRYWLEQDLEYFEDNASRFDSSINEYMYLACLALGSVTNTNSYKYRNQLKEIYLKENLLEPEVVRWAKCTFTEFLENSSCILFEENKEIQEKIEAYSLALRNSLNGNIIDFRFIKNSLESVNLLLKECKSRESLKKVDLHFGIKEEILKEQIEKLNQKERK